MRISSRSILALLSIGSCLATSTTTKDDYCREVVGPNSYCETSVAGQPRCYGSSQACKSEGVGVKLRQAQATDWDAYCREQVGGNSYCKSWTSDPVCQGSSLKCGGSVQPTTAKSTTAVKPATTTTSGAITPTTGVPTAPPTTKPITDWDAYCRDKVGAGSYCKTWDQNPVCQGSTVKCGSGAVPPTTKPVATTEPVVTTKPTTVAPITTTSGGGPVDWDAYCQEKVGGGSYCKTWDASPVCQGSTVKCGSGAVPPTTSTQKTTVKPPPATTTVKPPPATTSTTPKSTAKPATTTLKTTTTKAATTTCYESGTCVPDPAGAIAAIRAAIGSAYVLTGNKMPEVFIPQYTGITPAAVVRPGKNDEVEKVLQICFDYYVPVVARSNSGNSFAGQSTVQNGIVMMMDRFTSVNVETSGFLGSQFVAKIGAGTRLLEAYTRLYDHNPPLGINGGSCPSVSVSGLTQGGAYGYSSTMWGMLADHVLAVDIVVQENGGAFKLVHATRTNEHAELLKATRGGMGGNYGVVTTWYFDAIRASEKAYIYRHQVAANSKSKADVLAKTKAYQNIMINQPKSFGLWGKVKIHSNFEMHYEGMCLCDPITADCTDCQNTMKKIDDALQVGSWITKPSEKLTDAAYGAWSWAGCTKWADADCPSNAVYPGVGVDPTSAMNNCWNYDWRLNEDSPWKSNSVYVRQSDMTDALWDTLWDMSHQPECKGRNVCIITFEYYGGKMIQEPQDCSGAGPCTSFVHRNQGWNIQVSSLWKKGDSAGETTSTNWVAKAFAAIDKHSSLKTSYQNYISNQWTVAPWKDKFFPGQNVKFDHWKYRYFGPSSNGVYERLQDVKCRYNPYNLFITPSTADIVVQLPDDCPIS